MRWIHTLEYKFGKYYIRNLMLFIIGGMVIVYLGDMMLYGGVSGWLYFSRDAIFQGQVWRALSFIFIPPSGNLLPSVAGLGQVNQTMSPVFILISIYFVIYMPGKFLESQWGGFRLNLYYIMGVLFTIIGGFISPLGLATNTYLNSSLLLALATLMPDMQIRLFFVIPFKGWWFLILFFAYNLFTILQAFFSPVVGVLMGLNSLILFGFSLLNYLIFFGPTLISNFKQQLIIRRNRRQWRNRNK